MKTSAFLRKSLTRLMIKHRQKKLGLKHQRPRLKGVFVALSISTQVTECQKLRNFSRMTKLENFIWMEIWHKKKVTNFISNLNKSNFWNFQDVADCGGVKLALKAFKRFEHRYPKSEIVPIGLQNYDKDKLFFLSFAQTFCRFVTLLYFDQRTNKKHVSKVWKDQQEWKIRWKTTTTLWTDFEWLDLWVTWTSLQKPGVVPREVQWTPKRNVHYGDWKANVLSFFYHFRFKCNWTFLTIIDFPFDSLNFSFEKTSLMYFA